MIATKQLRWLLLFTEKKGRSLLAKYYRPGTYQSYWKQLRLSRYNGKKEGRKEGVRQHADDLQYRRLCFEYLSPVSGANNAHSIQSIFSENQ